MKGGAAFIAIHSCGALISEAVCVRHSQPHAVESQLGTVKRALVQHQSLHATHITRSTINIFRRDTGYPIKWKPDSCILAHSHRRILVVKCHSRNAARFVAARISHGQRDGCRADVRTTKRCPVKRQRRPTSIVAAVVHITGREAARATRQRHCHVAAQGRRRLVVLHRHSCCASVGILEVVNRCIVSCLDLRHPTHIWCLDCRPGESVASCHSQRAPLKQDDCVLGTRGYANSGVHP